MSNKAPISSFKQTNDQNRYANHPMLRIYSYAKPYWPWFLLVFVLILATTAMSLAKPKIVQMIIDQDLSVIRQGTTASALQEAAWSRMIQKILLYFGIVLLLFFGEYARFYFLQRTGQWIIRSIRSDIYNRILALSMKFFDHHAIGSLVTRATNDPESINEMFTSVLSSLLGSITSLIGIVVIMYAMNAKLATFVLGLTPFIVLISVVFRSKIRKVFKMERETLSLLNTKLSENISGMFEIQTFNKQEAIHQEFDEVNQKYRKIGLSEVTYFAIYRPAIEIVRTLGLAMLLWFGGVSQMKGLVSFGVLYAFLDYIERFFQPIMEMAMTFNVIQSAMTSANRVFHLIDEPIEVETGSRPVPAEGLRGEIEFDHVWFRYDEEGEWILKDVSFHARPGEFVAFVGATGAGKSTIMSLISRFYDIQKGRILVDGVDVRAYQLSDLRRAVGLVQQDVFLFTGDIMGNIRVGRDYVSAVDAKRAAEMVRADAFIQKLPNQYKEEVMERGATLSAGQRQLLSFARTIAADPSILILDEATSNIDTETELLIQDAIQKMAKNRTMLAVAHRISTIAGADKIIVMHHGEIAEEGTRDELLAKDGLFRVLYELQYQTGAKRVQEL